MSSSALSSVAVEALPLEVSNLSLDLFTGDDLGFLTFFSRGGIVVRGVTSSTMSRESSSGWLTDFEGDDHDVEASLKIFEQKDEE